MKHDSSISAEHVLYDAYLATDAAPESNVHTRTTLVPASYPALEREVYASLDFVCDRVTELPPPSEGM